MARTPLIRLIARFASENEFGRTPSRDEVEVMACHTCWEDALAAVEAFHAANPFASHRSIARPAVIARRLETVRQARHEIRARPSPVAALIARDMARNALNDARGWHTARGVLA